MSGDYTVGKLDALLDALSKAKAGQVVFIPGETEIDLTSRIYIEQLVLEVPVGVTLAGNRGQDGSKGMSYVDRLFRVAVTSFNPLHPVAPNVLSKRFSYSASNCRRMAKAGTTHS